MKRQRINRNYTRIEIGRRGESPKELLFGNFVKGDEGFNGRREGFIYRDRMMMEAE